MINQSLKVLIVEDEAIFRSLLKDHISATFPASSIIEAVDGEVAWNLFREHTPEFCIVDLRLPKLRGELLINLMQQHHLSPRILVLTNQALNESPKIMRTKNDVLFVEKTASLKELDSALHQLFGKSKTWNADLPTRVLTSQKGPKNEQLTDRETLVLCMIGEGKTNECVALALGISTHTVRTHRRNLMQKLGIHNAALLVRYALDHELSGLRH
jgi:DNA-binding NarL/FixJ family response regulator